MGGRGSRCVLANDEVADSVIVAEGDDTVHVFAAADKANGIAIGVEGTTVAVASIVSVEDFRLASPLRRNLGKRHSYEG